ncbi:MAG TPA: Crp/Fnr family transcriptional regulator [Candidatus Manganitrophaceae bacterium]|nr:Crp/Fnr family transcriptional regulator [Candidatus Manganitrophaceae bacterium]
MDKADLTRFIQECDLYSCFSSDQFALLQSKMKILSSEKGTFIYLPGDPSDQIYLIYSGSVRMATLIENGKEFTSSLYHAGETFGELGLAGELFRTETAITCEKTTLIGFKSDILKDLLRLNILFALKLMRLIGARRQESDNKLLQFFYAPVHSRLAKLLIHITTKRGAPPSHAASHPAHAASHPAQLPIQLRLTHETLASLAGTTRETTTMILNRFEKLGLIEKSKGSISIKDLQSLKAFSQSRTLAEPAQTYTHIT